MESSGRQLHFSAFLMSSGHHEAAWRLPQSDPFANFDLARKRGLFRTEYTGQTLRGHYGIPRPDRQFAQARGRVPEPAVA